MITVDDLELQIKITCDACSANDRALIWLSGRTRTQCWQAARKEGWFVRPTHNIHLCSAHKWIGHDKHEYQKLRSESLFRPTMRKN